MTKDLYNNLKLTAASLPAVRSGTNATVSGAIVDGQGFGSVSHVAIVGAAGDTLSNSVKIRLALLHGDEPDMSDAIGVEDYEIIGPSVDGDGIFMTVDSNAEAGKAYGIGYVGPKRYTRIVVTLTGAHSTGTPIAVVALQGAPSVAPVV